MKKYKIPEYTEMLLSNELKSYLLDIEDECKEKLEIFMKKKLLIVNAQLENYRDK